MKPPTSEDITRQLQQAHFPQAPGREVSSVPIVDTPMVVSLEQLRPYRYLEVSVRQNTSKSYAAALSHFEVTWGGFLPTTTESVVRYIAEYADQLALSTLKQRLAALANWHQSNGFPDPTKAPKVSMCC